MQNKLSNKTSIIIAVVVASLLAYYLLLHENTLHTSIAEIIDYSHSLEITQHVLILGILPIYIAVMVFGAVMVGIFMGLKAQQFLRQHAKN